jgi:iron complex outermembrane receptor protein
MKYFKNLLFITGILFTFSIAAFAQTGALSGTVTTQIKDELVPGVSVNITQLKLKTETDENGKYQFTKLPNGTYTVVTHIEGFADQAQSVTISGGAATLDFSLSLQSLSAEVVVSATGKEESIFETFSSVNSVTSSSITGKASTSIGEVLGNEAGITSRSFGGAGGSGRPSIRGFEGDRVLVTQDGVRNGSLGAQSGDHGEPVPTLNVERLEIIKGPATLLYGSNAIGGVVNAVTNDENEPHEGLRGFFTALGGTVNKQGGVAGGVEYGFKKYLFNLDLSTIREGDVETPLGKIPNSASGSIGGAGKLGYFTDKAFFRGTVDLDRRRYGIPYAPLFESGEILSIANGGADCEVVECQFNLDVLQATFANKLPPVPDEQVDIKMRRNNYRLLGGFRNVKGPVTQGNFNIDFTDYEHSEIETANNTETVATTFYNDVFSYRSVFDQADYKKLTGRFGFEGYRRSYETIGAESLIEGRVRQYNFSAFALEEFTLDKFSLQFGARMENNRYRPVNPDLPERAFTGFSGAFGVKYNAWSGGSLIANFSSSYRSPSLEELYNNGPHVGTVTFEVGNENLQRERTNGVEFSFRQTSKRVRFNGSVFYYNIDNFIYLAPQDLDGNGTIDVEDNLPISDYNQEKSRFLGADASLDFDINDYVGAFVIADIVNAELKNGNVPLPRITPPRLRIGTDLRYKGLSLRPEAVFVAKKGVGDIFTLETPTDGYALFNINGSYAFSVNKVAHIFTFGGQNLTDELYRNHTNFIKYLTPEPGRGFKVSYTVRFF